MKELKKLEHELIFNLKSRIEGLETQMESLIKLNKNTDEHSQLVHKISEFKIKKINKFIKFEVFILLWVTIFPIIPFLSSKINIWQISEWWLIAIFTLITWFILTIIANVVWAIITNKLTK